MPEVALSPAGVAKLQIDGKEVEIPVTDFASWLRTGKGIPLDDVGVPLIDRALDAMLDVLKKTETAN